jgi:AraC-like DNA-binding protein
MELHRIVREFQIDGFYTAFPFAWDEHFVFHGESHDFWEIVYLTDGMVEVTEDEKVYLLKKENMILHAPMEFHRIRSAGGSSPQGYIMSFHALGRLPEELKTGIFVPGREEGARYAAICEQIAACLAGTARSPYAGQEAADELAAFLIRLGGERAEHRPDTSPAATEYRRLVTAMTDGVCENKTLSDFAQECSVSVSYIKQLFRQYAGISPKAYYIALRVRHAAALLEEGRTVTEIAEQMNFSSGNYFSAFFKKHTGAMPSAYKKRLL